METASDISFLLPALHVFFKQNDYSFLNDYSLDIFQPFTNIIALFLTFNILLIMWYLKLNSVLSVTMLTNRAQFCFLFSSSPHGGGSNLLLLIPGLCQHFLLSFQLSHTCYSILNFHTELNNINCDFPTDFHWYKCKTIT